MTKCVVVDLSIKENHVDFDLKYAETNVLISDEVDINPGLQILASNEAKDNPKSENDL